MTATRPWSRLAGPIALSAALALGACSVEDASGGLARTVELDCERVGFPCTWGEVDPAVVRRTDGVGRIAAALMRKVQSPRDVADFLRAVPGMEEVQSGDLAVRFRLSGGRPAWISVPGDPARPRMGGAPGFLPGLDGPGEAKRGVAAKEAGQGKHALVLSPFEWQWPGKTVHIVRELESSRDYGRDQGGSVTYHANLAENMSNPQGPMPARVDDAHGLTRLALDGAVSLDDFRGWEAYNFVYLSTHGQAACGDDGCYTSLLAGQIMDGASALALEHPLEPGVEPIFESTNLHPGLTRRQAADCVKRMQAGVAAPRTEPAPEGTPCLFTYPKTYAVIALSTDFFRHEYEHGLGNIVLFFAACQSLKLDDLKDHFVQSNRNVAVLGYDEVVYSDTAAEIGELVADLMTSDIGPVMDTYALIDHVRNKTEFASVPFSGVAQGTAALPGKPARFVDRSSNPTHARDIVELVDPATGVELEDGGSVATFVDDAGARDGIRVGMRLRGVGGREDAGAIDLYLTVDGEQVGGPYHASQRVAPGVFDVAAQDIALGYDLGDRATVDLGIRAEWPGGESRWDYEDIRVGSGFTYRASGDLNLDGEGPFPGVIGIAHPGSPGCVVALPFHVAGADHSMRLVARLPRGLRVGTYRVAKSYTGNPETPFGSLDYDFGRMWISASTKGEGLTPGMFHAALAADKRYGTDDRDEDFVSRGGTVTVEAFDGKRLDLAFSIDLVQVAAEGEYGSELSPDQERLLESGHPFGGPAAKEAGRQRVREARAAYANNPPRRSTRVTGRLSHVISGRMSPPDVYGCKVPST